VLCYVSAVDPVQNQTTYLSKERKKQLKRADEHAAVAQAVIRGADDAQPTVNARFCSISPRAVKALRALRLISLIPGLFALPRIYKALKDLCVKEKTSQKMKAGYRALEHSATVLDASVDMALWLEAMNAVSEASIGWTAVAAPILLPFEAVSAGVGLHRSWKALRFQEKIADDPSLSGQAIKMVLKKSPSELKRHLHLPSGKKFKERVQRLFDKVHTAKGKEKKKAERRCVALLKEMKTRTRKNIAITLFATVGKVIGIASAILLICNPVGLMVLGLSITAAAIGVLSFYLHYKLKKAKIKAFHA